MSVPNTQEDASSRWGPCFVPVDTCCTVRRALTRNTRDERTAATGERLSAPSASSENEKNLNLEYCIHKIPTIST